MPAIITDRFKKELLLKLDADIVDSDNNYYVGIGRSYDWDSSDTAPTPLSTEREQRNAQLDLVSIKNVEAHSFVVPRYTWTLGAIYQSYNDNTVGHPTTSYYVITDENNVYVCLQQGKNITGQSVTSSVKPTGTLTKAFATADGYIWKFLYSVGALRASQFLASNFMPVTVFDGFDSDDAADQVEQVGIQNAAVKGEIVGFEVEEGGTGYTTAPSLTIYGNGTGAKGSVSISGGAVTKVELVDSDGEYALGRNYTYASAVVTGGNGTGAKVRPILGPRLGLGADPRDDLRATAMMFTAKPDGDEGGDWIVGNDFRQVSLIKNPLKGQDVDSDFTGNTGNALRRLEFATVSSNFTVDKTILGATSQTTAYVSKVDSDTVWFIQNETTGFKPFEEGEAISETDGNGSGVLEAIGDDADTDAYVEGEIRRRSGEVVYIDNRAAVSRSTDQKEDIKIIIQL